jgi:Cupin
VDALAGLLDGVRARGAFVLRLSLDPPWAMRIQDEAPLTLICQTQGHAVIVADGDDATWLAPGDIALARGTRHYVFADNPATSAQIVIHPGQRCTTAAGTDLRFEMAVGVRTWGNTDSGAHRSVIGAYEGRSAVSARLLEALPPLVVLRGSE